MIVEKVDAESRKPKNENVSDFEDAIAATKFGLFNVFIMFVNFFPNFSQVTETVAMSYVLPIAQCDLNLSLEEKGVLNSVTFTGMIVSGFAWGYICDTLGRKKVMVYGYLANGLIALLLAFSPNITMILVLKFFAGFIINGPYGAAAAHFTEFHSKTTRARIQIYRGVTLTVGNILLPLIAWAILPRNIEFMLFGHTVHSWNLFLLVCALPPLISSVCYALLPESPKFLMSKGNNEQAFKVFQKVYRINTRKDVKTYPIVCLKKEKLAKEGEEKENIKGIKSIFQGLHQFKELFKPPYVWNALLTCTIVFLLYMSMNSLKLWLPEIFQAVNDYQMQHNTSSDLCTMIEELTPTNTSSECTVNLDNVSVYINSITVGIARAVCLAIAASIVNLVGTKRLAIVGSVITAGLIGTLHMASNALAVTILSSSSIGVGNAVETILTTITLELFPTTCRAMAFSLYLMFGRLGGIFGITLFPFLLYGGCSVPFYVFGSVILGSTLLYFLLPNVDNKPLT